MKTIQPMLQAKTGTSTNPGKPKFARLEIPRANPAARWSIRLLFSWMVMVCFLLPGHAASAAEDLCFDIGANVNESLTQLDPVLLERSHTKWVRGFLPALQFIYGQRNLATDPGVQALKRSARSGCKLIVSLKWDLRETQWHVPAPGSDTEAKWFAWVDALTDELPGQISILSLVNEVFIDTLSEDLKPQADGTVPMMEFLQRLTAHEAARKLKAAGGGPLPLYCGGFTRLDTKAVQTNAFALQLMKWCDTNSQIAGVDFHLHQMNYAQFERALNFIRQRVKAKPFIVTEYSLIWNYKAHLDELLGTGASGVRFCEQYQLPASLTVRDYINRCLKSPVSEPEWNDFVRSRAWLDPEFINQTSKLMKQHGVMVATYALSQKSSGGRQLLGSNATPWLLNPIFVPCTARAINTNSTAVNLSWFNAYMAQHTGSTDKSGQQASSNN